MDETERHEAQQILDEYVASLRRLGYDALAERYLERRADGERVERFPIVSEQLATSGRTYQFETHVAIEGEDLHVFVSIFPDRRARLAQNADFIVRSNG